MAAKRKFCTILQEVDNVVSEIWCVTEIKATEYSHLWIINNFERCCKNRQVFDGNIIDTKWQLQLNLTSNENYYILIRSYDIVPKAFVNICCLNANEEKINLKAAFLYNLKENCFKHYFSKTELLKNNLLLGDKLKILIKLKAITTIANTTNQTNQTNQKNNRNFQKPQCTLTKDLANCLDKQKFCDITFVVEGHQFQAHKAMLAASSAAFADMIVLQEKENELYPIVVTDINHEAFKEMVNFIYTDKAPNLQKMPIELLKAADGYDLKKLKAMCEAELCCKLSEETAADTLITADLYKAKELKAQTVTFIKMYASLVQQTEGWQNLIAKYEQLIKENDLNF